NPDGKVDLTARSTKMGRDECIVFPNRKKDAEHPTQPDFHGTIRLSGGHGHYYHVALWKQKLGFNLWLSPWKEISHTGVPPLADLTPVKLRLLPTRSGSFNGETRKPKVELRPALCNGQEVWWLKVIARKEVAK